MKTTIPDEIMDRMADRMEELFKKSKVFYKREGTVFLTYPKDVNYIHQFQSQANLEFIKKGIITKEMIKNDLNLFR